MAEPTNTKHRDLMEVRKGKIPLELLQREKQGALSPAESAKRKEPFESCVPNGMQEMDLKRVDNDNKGSYNGEKIAKQKANDDNADFDRLHDDFRPIVDAKKKPGAGE